VEMLQKRICLISLNLAGGGAQRVLLNQAEMFASEGYRVDIIIMKNKVEYQIDNNLYNVHFLSETRYISTNKLLNLIYFYKKMKHEIDKLESKNGNFHLFLSHSYDTDQLLKFFKKNNKFSVIHGTMSKYLKDWSFAKRQLFKFVYKNAKICGVSKGVKDDLLNIVGIKPSQINVIYNSFNLERIRQLSKKPMAFDNQYILYVGSINKIKRLDILIKAYKQANITQKLVILGGSNKYSEYSQMIHKLVENLDLNERVFFKKFIKNPYPFIKNASLLVVSSDHEGLPTVLIEALALNTMVVSTDCESGPSEILTDELSDFLTPVGDYYKLAEKIVKALDNPIKNFKKFSSAYDQKVIFNQYQKLIEEG
jgi:glycosyltransferase involved in cell wall biosynthesis